MGDKAKIEASAKPEAHSGVLKHLNKWKNLYEVGGILVAVVISFLSVVVSFLSLRESHNAIKLTEQSVQIQKKEYEVRNRPYIILDNPVFGGPAMSLDGTVSPQSIKLEIKNVSDIPARKVNSLGLVYIDDKEVARTAITESAQAKDTSVIAPFNVPAPLYILTNENVVVRLVVTTTYYGMFEQQTPYETVTRCRYNPKDNAFGQTSLEIK
jgi:hypothetical protein